MAVSFLKARPIDRTAAKTMKLQDRPGKPRRNTCWRRQTDRSASTGIPFTPTIRESGQVPASKMAGPQACLCRHPVLPPPLSITLPRNLLRDMAETSTQHFQSILAGFGSSSTETARRAASIRAHSSAARASSVSFGGQGDLGQ